jgi:hypothetical protein
LPPPGPASPIAYVTGAVVATAGATYTWVVTGGDELDAGDVPSTFVAVIVNVYEVDDLRPKTVTFKSLQELTFFTSPLLDVIV